MLPDLPEVLTQGRERALFDWLFDKKSAHHERITSKKRSRYVECYERSGGMAQGFAYYRAVAKSTKQNETVSRQKLPMPTLALGGDQATAEKLRESMESFAEHVEGGIIEDCGHYVMEEQPEQVTRRLLAFFNTVEGQR